MLHFLCTSGYSAMLDRTDLVIVLRKFVLLSTSGDLCAEIEDDVCVAAFLLKRLIK